MAIKVYSDAGSNLFSSIVKEKELDITVLPMTLDADGKSYYLYEDDIDVVSFSKSFYALMRKGAKVKTSLVNTGLFLEVFQKEVDAGNEVVCFTMSSGISGTCQSAVIAATEINEKAGKEVVHVVDSKTAGFGEGRMAIHAAEMAKSGASYSDVCKEADHYVQLVRSEFMVDDPRYLVSTGRVNPIVAKIASVLNIKVLLKGSTEGKIVNTGKVHGSMMAIKTLANVCLQKIVNKDQTVYISHCDSEENALKLKQMLNAGGVNNVEVYYYDLVTGAHVGPGTIAIFYESDNRD